MKVYSTIKTGNDGLQYSLRMLLEPSELQGLQSAGIIGNVNEVIGMQEVADSVMAGYQLQMHTACGGLTQ